MNTKEAASSVRSFASSWLEMHPQLYQVTLYVSEDEPTRTVYMNLSVPTCVKDGDGGVMCMHSKLAISVDYVLRSVKDIRIFVSMLMSGLVRELFSQEWKGNSINGIQNS